MPQFELEYWPTPSRKKAAGRPLSLEEFERFIAKIPDVVTQPEWVPENVVIEADDVRAALEAAPKIEGFVLDTACEIIPEDSDRDPDDAVFADLVAHCDGCGKVIISGDEYRLDSEGGLHFCVNCKPTEEDTV